MQDESSEEVERFGGSGTTPPVPTNEAERLEAVTRLNQVHAENQPALIALRNTARTLLRAPVAFIGFIEEETQRLLTVCIVPQNAGNALPATEFKEMVTPRDCSVCQYTILESDHLVIPDLTEFIRTGKGRSLPAAFRKQAEEVGGYPIPWPAPDGGIEMRPAHFYAGATIKTRSGAAVGTFCIVDVVPRPDFGEREIDILESLARQAGEYLEERALLRHPANLQLLQDVQKRAASEDSTPSTVDVAVLGAGPAGATAACRLSFQGLKVALIEPKSRFGAPTGVSSKILREVAIEHGNATTWEHVDEVRNWIAEQDASRVRTQLDRYGVTLLQGKGTLAGTDPATGNTRVIIRDREGESREILTRATILSTGSRARRLPGIPYEIPGVYDSDSINRLPRKPASLLIQGTGVIALEYATIFAAMGVSVTVAARRARENILPRLDHALRDALLMDLEAKKVEILYHCSITSIEPDDDGVRVHLVERGNAVQRSFEAVLSAVGRVPVKAGLGLETLQDGEEDEDRSRLETNGFHRLSTERGSVYAVGDVSGSGLACRAVVQAQEVVSQLLPRLVQGKDETETLPATSASRVGTASVIWAIPELAFVGQTMQEAQEAYGPDAILAVQVPFSETIRGSLSSLPSSHFLKLVCLRQDGRIVGVHLYGEGASELIHLGASLVANSETVFKLQYRTFPAVTLHEIYRNGAHRAIDLLAAQSQGTTAPAS